MRDVLFEQRQWQGLFLGSSSSIKAFDVVGDVYFLGLHSALKVVNLTGLQDWAIYLNGKRIIEHRSGINLHSKKGFFSKDYFSVYGESKVFGATYGDKIFYKDYEPAKNFGALVKGFSEKRDKFGNHLIYLKGEVVMRSFMGAGPVEWFRCFILDSKDKQPVLTSKGFAYDENKIDVVLALVFFIFQLNEFYS